MTDRPGTVATILLVGSNPGSRLPALVWSAVALLSVSVATLVALQPGAMRDLWLVRDWLAHYWIEGRNPYAFFVGSIDYPPQAFVVLWPLQILPAAWAPAIKIAVHLVTLSIAGWILARWLSGRLAVHLRRSDELALVAIMFVGGSSRGAIWRGQTMGVALMLGALALQWSQTRPWLAGLCLGLLTFKPHVAVGFMLAVWLTGRRAAVGYGLAVAAALVLVFAARVQEPAIPILMSYAQTLVSMYEGPDTIPGLLSIRWILNDVFGAGGVSLWVYLVLALTAAYPLFRAARTARGDGRLAALVAMAALAWSVVFLPFQLYGSLLVVPAVWLLMWPESTVLGPSANRLAIVGSIMAFRVLDVPRSIRLLTPRLGGPDWVLEWSYYLSPIVPALLLTLLVAAIVRYPKPARAYSAEQAGSSMP